MKQKRHEIKINQSFVWGINALMALIKPVNQTKNQLKPLVNYL